MANQWHEGHKLGGEHYDIWTGAVFVTAPAVWPVWPWFQALWEHFPTPTAAYMAISTVFMLFQMCDKMGLLDRLKKRGEMDEPPDNPA